MDDKILKTIYTFFLGLILALFIGFGISTFYTGPKMPEYPSSMLESGEMDKEQSKKLDQDRSEYEQSVRDHQTKSEEYNRNVSVIALVSAVVLVVISLIFEKSNRIIANGVMLGGLFTLLYSLIRGLAANDSKYPFMAATVGVVIILYLSYRHFSQDKPADKPHAKLVRKR